MTAHILCPSFAGPIMRHLDTTPQYLNASNLACANRPNNSSLIANLFPLHQDDQTSTASAFSVASAPPMVANENVDPIEVEVEALSTPSRARPVSKDVTVLKYPSQTKRSMSCSQNERKVNPQNSPRTALKAIHVRQPLAELGEQKRKPQPLHRRIRPMFGMNLPAALSSNADLHVGTYAQEAKSTDASIDGHDVSQSLQSPHGTSQPTTSVNTEADTHANLECTPKLHHRKRLSTASSGFVHTIKTASLSNASFSLAPLSTRIGRSTDSYLAPGSHHRPSIDSDRPATNSSMDDAAFRRGLRRRQIIGELVRTEESYVADLKSLIYVYSTLLATSMSFPSELRTTVQRNFHELLHIHERLLDRLHQVGYEAAVRKWADTSSPLRLGSARQHRRWLSLETNLVSKFGHAQRHRQNSVDSGEMIHGRAELGCSEPRDVSDIAILFKEFLNDFSAYEEYCANHSIVAHELQKQVTTLWSTYESGMESLAKSLVAIDHRKRDERRGGTVGDLLIKPIQRLTKYPLLFEDLLRQTPVSDCPSTHVEVEATIQCLRELVRAVNGATNNSEARAQVLRRQALQSRLNYERVTLQSDNYRLLGDVHLCGVLYVTWQTKRRIDGAYAVCVLFDFSLLIALPAGTTPRLDLVAFLHLSDLKIESASDGQGLQCHSTLHTWKICARVGGNLSELILSACSSNEEAVWKDGLRGRYAPKNRVEDVSTQIPSSVSLDLRSVGAVYGPQSTTLDRNPSRSATVGNRANVYQVIIRNTHNPQDLHEYRQTTSSSINRSQSHMTSNRIVILSPKRSERARLESSLADIWTKDKLPFPGMIGSRGGQIIRASAGSLARKLSLASIHAPFSRRTGSISVASRKSYDTMTDGSRSKRKVSPPVFEVRKESFEELTSGPARKKSHEVPEIDTMDNLVSRMIGNSGSKKSGFSQGIGDLTPSHTSNNVLPEDPADIVCSEEKEKSEKDEVIEQSFGGKRKRWSNPIGILKGLSSEGLRHMLYSSK
ncbi:hypothetical protein LTR84_006490 [Exophiala bonariae]|uniref:DH domain-containing protein n=1 Tax=Exophiala bonariae TaxID=1690606 RepID=A0AAV9N4V7_9EURO|nr:hypothetical protein LTR84_006490 [Exophiala bonariae]